MTKDNNAEPKPKTHFEQIPIEVVKAIVRPELIREPSSKKTEPYSIRPVSYQHSAY